jgi:hypothetical protein
MGSISNRTITVTNFRTNEEIELIVTFKIINDTSFDEEDMIYDINNDIEIISYEPYDDELEIPSWVTEDMVYDVIVDEVLFNDDDEDDIFLIDEEE